MADAAAIDAADLDGTLFGLEQLNPEEASRLLARGPGRLVVLMGEQGAGKTTIVTELYERQRRPDSPVRFAGSWTLLAFERLAAARRATGHVPPAARDNVDPEGRELLHIALSCGEGPLHLLLSDLPGEIFRRLADNQLGIAELPWLRRADKLVLVVDGAQLRDVLTRSATVTRVRQLRERLEPFDLARSGTRLALVVTKWDLVAGDPGAVAYWTPREAELLAELRALDPDARALRVSADAPAPEDGLAALRAWLLELPLAQVSAPAVNPSERPPAPPPPPAPTEPPPPPPAPTEPAPPPPAPSELPPPPPARAEPAPPPAAPSEPPPTQDTRPADAAPRPGRRWRRWPAPADDLAPLRAWLPEPPMPPPAAAVSPGESPPAPPPPPARPEKPQTPPAPPEPPPTRVQQWPADAPPRLRLPWRRRWR